ncbi:hypothetical protein AB8880_08530 [Alphaproteobacteria bacterium LSUCC0684]
MMPVYSSRFAVFLAAVLAGIAALEAIAQPMVPRHQHPSYESICEAHTPDLEKAFDLPPGVLTAISRVESGRPNAEGIRQGWPWTINHDGKGLFFETKDEMLAYARSHIEKGDRRMDLGCMQISLFWHGDAFSSLDEMADPPSNIAYAAAFLADLSAQHGSLDQAIRRYHNADPKANTPYVARVYDVWQALAGDADLTSVSPPQEVTAQPNTASTRAIPAPASITPAVIMDAPVVAPSPRPVSASQVEADPLAAVRARQPHLKGKWDRVVLFRKMLNP